jgi:hypothetical protein
VQRALRIVMPLVPALRQTSITIILTAAIGCGGSPIGPTSDAQVRVAGSVLDFQTNAGVGGARVTIGNVTAATDPTGGYSLTVPAGEQRVSIDGETLTLVTLEDRTYRGDFYVHVTGCVARYGTVVDKQSRKPVSGASVSVGGATVATDQTGWFRLDLGCPGIVCIGSNTTFLSVTHPNYVTGSFPAGRGVCFVERVDYELEPR